VAQRQQPRRTPDRDGAHFGTVPNAHCRKAHTRCYEEGQGLENRVWARDISHRLREKARPLTST